MKLCRNPIDMHANAFHTHACPNFPCGMVGTPKALACTTLGNMHGIRGACKGHDSLVGLFEARGAFEHMGTMHL